MILALELYRELSRRLHGLLGKQLFPHNLKTKKTMDKYRVYQSDVSIP